MQAARAHREHLTGDRFARLSEIPYKYFTNCQLIIYTDENPATGAITPGRLWVKSVCPWTEGQFGHDWLLVSCY